MIVRRLALSFRFSACENAEYLHTFGWNYMASRTVTDLSDDIDSSPSERTVIFAIDGETFEIDLSRTHRNTTVRELARYMAAGRRIKGDGPQPVFMETRADPRAVREWARGQGIELPSGKRVPADVIRQFHAA